MPVTVLPSRRGVLRAAAGAPIVLLVACSNDAESQPTDADDSVRSEVANNEQQLISRYDATIAAYPALASKLTPLRDQHAQHLSAMGTARQQRRKQPNGRQDVGSRRGGTDCRRASRFDRASEIKRSGGRC